MGGSIYSVVYNTYNTYIEGPFDVFDVAQFDATDRLKISITR